MHGIQNLGKAVSLHLCMVQVTQQLVTPQQMTWLEVTQPRVTQQQHLMPLETLLLLFPQIKQLHLHHQMQQLMEELTALKPMQVQCSNPSRGFFKCLLVGFLLFS